MRSSFAVSSVVLYATQALAWGAAGHEIVATIAQIHLHPTAADRLCSILPDYARCHLAPVASWADKIRMHMRWSGPLHYVNGIGDHPSQKCVFGEEGWNGPEGHNVLGGVRNTTMWLEKGYDGAEEALKFLVHFVGDMHQPLHLTGRDKGGNGMKVRFDKRITNLHSVWDNSLIAKSLRTIPRKYTRPGPIEEIENALRGTIYDPYVRQIMYEGVFDRFKDEIQEWTTCPPVENVTYTRSSRVMRNAELKALTYAADSTSQIPMLGAIWSLLGLGTTRVTSPLDIPSTDDDIICPYAWSKPNHKLNCDIIWPAALDEVDYDRRHDDGLLELDTPEYAGKIKEEFLVERMLAMGGVRLAAILNYLFADVEARA